MRGRLFEGRMAEPIDAEFILRRMEEEYRRVLAADRRVEASTADVDEGDEEAAAAEGYVQLGLGSGDEDEDEDEMSDANAEQYAELEGGSDDDMPGPPPPPKAMTTEQHQCDSVTSSGVDAVSIVSFIGSPFRTKREYEEFLQLPRVEQAASLALAVGKYGHAPEQDAAVAASAPDDSGSIGNGDADWADFSMLSEQPPSDTPQLAQPLPLERVAAIREVMAGLTLAPPPPSWAGTVPETVWMQTLLTRPAAKGKGAAPPGKGSGNCGGGDKLAL